MIFEEIVTLFNTFKILPKIQNKLFAFKFIDNIKTQYFNDIFKA